MEFESIFAFLKIFPLVFFWGLSFFVFFLDQCLKLSRDFFIRGDWNFLPAIFHYQRVDNQGIAFGFFQNQFSILIPLTFFFIVGIIWVYRQEEFKSMPMEWGYALLLGGALGNLVDRVFLGYVRDFIGFAFWPQFPFFNLADVCIDLGILLIFVHYLKLRGIKNHAS